jgi:hypothetical protein
MPPAIGGVREKWRRGIDCPALTMSVEGLRERLQQLRCRGLAASAESDRKENSSRSVSAHFTPPKAASKMMMWKGKQLISIGKLVTTDKLPVRCVLRRKWLIFNNSTSTTKTGTCEACGGGRQCAQ